MAGIEPATPCLQNKWGKALKALSSFAYTERKLSFRSLNCPEVVPKLLGYQHC